MSVEVMAAVFQSDIGPANKRVVLLALANRADAATGLCWPGVDLLSADAGMSRATLFRVLTDLEKDGLISRKRRRSAGKQNSSAYRVNMAAVQARRRPAARTAEVAEIERLFDDPDEKTDAPADDPTVDEQSAGQSSVADCDPDPDQQEHRDPDGQTSSAVQRLRMRPSPSHPETESVSDCDPNRKEPSGTGSLRFANYTLAPLPAAANISAALRRPCH